MDNWAGMRRRRQQCGVIAAIVGRVLLHSEIYCYNPHNIVTCLPVCFVKSCFMSIDTAAFHAFSALTLLVGQQEGHPSCKKMGMVEVGTG